MNVTVLLVDDVAELRAIVRAALELRGGFEVVAEAADGAAAMAEASRHHPDVVVLDWGLPDLAGHEVISAIHARSPESGIVVYSGSVTGDASSIASRVEGYVRKDQDIAYLVELLADLGRRRQKTAVVLLPPGLEHVADAREFVRQQCRAWGVNAVVDEAALVVSELVTNAFVHAGSEAELRLTLAEQCLRIEVTDSGPGMPDPKSPPLASERGRGLLLVSACCMAWGVEARGEGKKAVWAELAITPGSGRASGTARETNLRICSLI